MLEKESKRLLMRSSVVGFGRELAVFFLCRRSSGEAGRLRELDSALGGRTEATCVHDR